MKLNIRSMEDDLYPIISKQNVLLFNKMSFYDVMTTEYWNIPLWGWLLILVGLIGIIFGIQAISAKKTDKDVSSDPEAGNIKVPEASPPKTPSQDFPRDAPLPPPAPSETSEKGKR